MKGRKPIPTALKIARGNPGQRRLPEDEPQPSTVFDLAVPDILAGNPAARAEWETKAPLFHRVGLLTEVDLDALTLYCATFAHCKQAERHLQRHGLTVLVGKKKTRIMSPYLAIFMKLQVQCRAMLIEFGLTPVSRSRVHLPKPDTGNAQRDRFFGPIGIRRKAGA